MTEAFTILLTSHLISDFLLQPKWIVARKGNLLILVLHTLIVTAVAALLLGVVKSWAIPILFFSHLIIDFGKSRIPEDNIIVFTLDQLLHLSVIVILAVYFSGLAKTGIWYQLLSPEQWSRGLQGAVLLSGLILCVSVGGVIIARATGKLLSEQEREYAEGLTNGGKYIGWLERTLIFLLMLTNITGGIGFLFAAKSILRIGEIKDSKHRAVTEYIIIGSFFSFGWGILWSFLTLHALRLW